VTVAWRHVWRIEPRRFDQRLIELCAESVKEVTGDAPRLASGPLHDAVEMGRLMPAVMMFAYSSRGLSHCKQEDTPEPYLAQAIDAFLNLIERVVRAPHA
jgi:N-carbamoyl-L-amino-acid hydrolase